MPVIDFPHNFLEGLSDFWQRFFNEADQLDALYRGSAILMGQAYLDLLANVLNVSLKDTPIFDKEYFRLVTLREDQLRFERGWSVEDDRWVHDVTDDLVSFGSLDNRVLEPTASLQDRIDYDLAPRQVRFKADPTDPTGAATPLPGFARRSLDVTVGGTFDDSARAVPETWMSRGVRKGDTLRLVDVGPDPAHPQQRKRSDHVVTLVRASALHVGSTTPLTAAAEPRNYVVLRRPSHPAVDFEALEFSTGGPPVVAHLAHARIDAHSVRIFAKGPSGLDVVEDEDYLVDHERGRILRLTEWKANSANKGSYTWMEEIWPTTGPLPRVATTGIVRSGPTQARVLQMALWAPDALVDRRTLAQNFGSLIGVERDSSENYREFLRGVFQLYALGPVMERLESALNVVLGLPVIRDDDEVFVRVDTSEPSVNRVITKRPTTGQIATYEFPKKTPLRAELNAAAGALTFLAFEPLTTAVKVTDYIQDPKWFHGAVIPPEVFPRDGGAPPSTVRRTASPDHVHHVLAASDRPKFGDPGLKLGADENGFSPPPGQPILRHRLAFVLMDRMLKYHTFYVRFDPTVFSGGAGARFARSFNDLHSLVFAARPAHTFAFVQPATTFLDEVRMPDEGVYQPQDYPGADPDAPSVYPSVAALPDAARPYVMLGVALRIRLAAQEGHEDKIRFADGPPRLGASGWRFGDHFRYENLETVTAFPAAGAGVVLPEAPSGPRHRRVVHLQIRGTAGGRRLTEDLDYRVDRTTAMITRLTVWDQLAALTVIWTQLNIGNVAAAPADRAMGDTPLLLGGIDPARRAADAAESVDWFGQPVPAGERDMSLVEHPVTIKVRHV